MKPRITLGIFIAAALAVAMVLAFFVSPQASSQPDGLNKVAIDQGFSDNEKTHALDSGPTAGYAVTGVGNDRLATGLAGLIGVTVTFAVAGGLFLVVRQTRRPHEAVGHGAP
ncbi:MAG: PDGLE domain-containing protein [Acidimicrobiales bacterium]